MVGEVDIHGAEGTIHCVYGQVAVDRTDWDAERDGECEDDETEWNPFLRGERDPDDERDWEEDLRR